MPNQDKETKLNEFKNRLFHNVKIFESPTQSDKNQIPTLRKGSTTVVTDYQYFTLNKISRDYLHKANKKNLKKRINAFVL